MLRYGLKVAVEAKVLADVNGTSGIQSQTYATSVLTMLRKGITKLEVAGYSPAAFALHPTDFEDVELALSAQNAIEHLGLPYNPASLDFSCDLAGHGGGGAGWLGGLLCRRRVWEVARCHSGRAGFPRAGGSFVSSGHRGSGVR